jgi:hypothetical protein
VLLSKVLFRTSVWHWSMNMPPPFSPCQNTHPPVLNLRNPSEPIYPTASAAALCFGPEAARSGMCPAPLCLNNRPFNGLGRSNPQQQPR